jgi:hypothetical protein
VQQSATFRRGVVTGSAGYSGFNGRVGVVNFRVRQDIWRSEGVVASGVGRSVCRWLGRCRSVGLWRREQGRRRIILAIGRITENGRTSDV